MHASPASPGSPRASGLPRGLVPVVQVVFTADDQLDHAAVRRLIEDALAAGADGFLVPAVASEVGFLSSAERVALVETVLDATRSRAPVVLGISDTTPAGCLAHAHAARALPVAAHLAAVPAALYARETDVPAFFAEICAGLKTPLIVQDLQFDGPGLSAATLAALLELPGIAGFKIETVPAGPKYTQVRALAGARSWIAGGWAVPQMIEALDRGVDALVPECAMIRVYQSIAQRHRRGDRAGAVALFRELLPVLAFANQEIATSVAFFKRLLVRKGIFPSAAQRLPLPAWDDTSERIAQELITHYLRLEASLGTPGSALP